MTFLNRLYSRSRLLLTLITLISAFYVSPGYSKDVSAPQVPTTDTITVRVQSSDLSKLGDIQVLTRTDYSTFSIIQVPKSAISSMKAAQIRVQEETATSTIVLQARTIDTRAAKDDIDSSVTPGSSSLFILQFIGPTKPEWLAAIKKEGGVTLNYIPENSYLVWIDPAAFEKLDSAGFIHWKGIYRPNYKIAKDLSNATGQIDYISVVIYDDAKGDTLKKISRLGGKFIRSLGSSLRPGITSSTVIFSIDASLLDKVAKLPKVVHIDRFSGKGGTDDEAACQIVSGHHTNGIPSTSPAYKTWLQQIGVDGTGSTIAVVDTGCDTNDPQTAHTDLRNRFLFIPYYPAPDPNTDTSGHGTHVAGIIAGNGARGILDDDGLYYGVGVAPGSNLVVQNALACTYFPPMGGWEMLTFDSIMGGAFVSNNSWWSSPTLGLGYSSVCATFDALTRDANTLFPGLQPLAMVFSIGNEGPGMSTILEPKEAKNIITVGASESYRASILMGSTCGKSTNVNAIANFSSRGPCIDGRIAPTVVAPGTNIASAASASGSYNAQDCKFLVGQTGNSYAWMSGSSQAAPMVSGALALFGQWWRANHSDTNPSPAMCKAIVVNGADDIAGGPDGRGGILDHIPNGDQGWGRLNIAACINPPNTYFEDQSYLFTSTGQVRQYTVTASDQSKPLKITLVWTDAPGTPGANAWVNDLDIELTGNTGTYYGNVFQNGWSIVGGERDRKNNTECIYIPHPSGSYTITVIAANIAGDAVPENDSPLDQDYALVIRNGAVTVH